MTSRDFGTASIVSPQGATSRAPQVGNGLLLGCCFDTIFSIRPQVIGCFVPVGIISQVSSLFLHRPEVDQLPATTNLFHLSDRTIHPRPTEKPTRSHKAKPFHPQKRYIGAQIYALVGRRIHNNRSPLSTTAPRFGRSRPADCRPPKRFVDR